ncbi:MAG: chromate transporter [Anaerolineaceae bacterium]
MNILQYFWIFLKASLLSFGGLSNLPYLHRDLVALNWASESDFISAIAVGQLSPGPSGLWSISLGYLTLGWLGGIIALITLSIPPFLTLLTTSFYHQIEKFTIVKNFSRGLMIAVIGLTLGTTWSIATSTIVEWRDILIVLAAFGLAISKKVPVILILALAGLVGFWMYS